MKRILGLFILSIILNIHAFAQATYSYEESLLGLSGDGAFIAVTGRSIEDTASSTGRKYMVDIYDTATGKLVLEYGGSEFPITSLAMNEDGRLLSFANKGEFLSITNTTTAENIRNLANGFRDVGWPRWSSDDQLFAFAVGTGIPIFDGSSFQIYGSTSDVNSFAVVVGFGWHPNTTRLASSMYDPNSGEWSILIWDVVSEQNVTLEKSLAIQGGAYFSWNPNGDAIVTDLIGGVKIIDIASSTETFLAIPDPDEPIYSVAWSPDGTKIAAGGNQSVYIWDVQSQSIIETIPTEDVVRDVFWSPDGQYIYHSGGTAGVYRNGIPLQEAIAQSEETSNSD